MTRCEPIGIAARALEFAILTAMRTSEAIGAAWDEIEGDVSTAPQFAGAATCQKSGGKLMETWAAYCELVAINFDGHAAAQSEPNGADTTRRY